VLTISVVIPARNAAETLGRTLSALRANTIQPQEILVVDGLSSDGTGEIARDCGCRLLDNPLRHTAAARQLGLAVARSRIVAMTDADCVPASDWLARICDHFERDLDLQGAGGPVHLNCPATRVQAYCARKARAGIPDRAELITRKGMRGRFSGANCAYRRQAVLDAGGYDYDFRAHGEDIDLFWRLIDRQARLLYDPALSVEHLDFARDYRTLARKSFGYGVASRRLDRAHFPARKADLSLLWTPWSEAMRELLREDGGRYPQCVLVDRLMFALGRAWGSVWDRAGRRRE
jgi:glycosyltransferase involved in cell wall biosynthesis